MRNNNKTNTDVMFCFLTDSQAEENCQAMKLFRGFFANQTLDISNDPSDCWRPQMRAYRAAILAFVAMPVLLVGCLESHHRSASPPEVCSKLNQIVQEVYDSYEFPGATAALALPDGKVCATAVGYADPDSNIEMNVESRMLSASIGKTYVSATALSLVGEGVLELDAPISKWLADESFFDLLPNASTITVRHLLTHSSGLVDHVYMKAFADLWAERGLSAPALKPRETIATILGQPALFKPGEGFSYTDTGYLLVGLIIEKASNKNYYQVLTETFLEPFALTRTSPSNKRDLKGLVPGYLSADNPLGVPTKTLDNEGLLVYDPLTEWTGGGLVNNSQDLARWGRILFGGRAMDWDYRTEMFKGVRRRNQETEYPKYGLGVTIFETSDGKSYGHGGWIPGYRSLLVYLAKTDSALAVQINTDIEMIGDETALDELRARLSELLLDASAS